MPQIVQPDRRQPGHVGKADEMPTHERRIQPRPVLAAEDETGVRPGRTPGGALAELPPPVLCEHGSGAWVQRDDANAARGLRLRDRNLARDADQLLDNAQNARVQVDVNPAQSTHLPPAQAGRNDDVKERVQPIVGYGVEKGADLLRRPDPGRNARRRRKLNQASDIDIEEPLPNRAVQSSAKCGPDPVHSRRADRTAAMNVASSNSFEHRRDVTDTERFQRQMPEVWSQIAINVADVGTGGIRP